MADRSKAKPELRQTVRQHVGDVIRSDPRADPSQAGVGSVTSLLPSQLQLAAAPGTEAPTPESTADEVVTRLFRHTRYLLTLKSRPPFRLAGLETYNRLHDVASFGLELLSQHNDPRLAERVQGLGSALSPFAQPYADIQQGVAWLHDIAYILEPLTASPRSAPRVARQLRGYLDTVRDRPDLSPSLARFGAHLDQVSRS